MTSSSPRYANKRTRQQNGYRVTNLFEFTGRQWPSELTEADLFRWVTAVPANNSVRQRLSTAAVFLRWCVRKGHAPRDFTQELDGLKKQYPRVYGKVQSANPGRWLTKDEAFGKLLDACRDGTWVGSRDHLAVRLGLLGVRAEELIRMTFAACTPDRRLVWIGKGRRQRTVTPGPVFWLLFDRWKRQYEMEIGHPVRPSDPLLCGNRQGSRAHIAWGRRIGTTTTLYKLVLRRATAAGLGHVAPHDLRRTAAGIMHSTRTEDDGHVFDLLDIQQVLDHADPATTQRSYLDPMGSEVKQMAGHLLD